MAPEEKVEPALFRLRVFEEQWLQPLRSAAADDPLDLALLTEAERWISIGGSVGYFAAASGGQPMSAIEAPTTEAKMIVKWIGELRPPQDLDAATFSQALAIAREDLTPERRSFLRLAIFASEDEWNEAVGSLSSFRSSLEMKEPGSLDDLAAVSWALEGELEECINPEDELQLRLPAGWRQGSMLVLRERSTRINRRVEAVIGERTGIANALEETLDPSTTEEGTIRACREAAARHDWHRFDDLFRQHLMRGHRAYLSETLGAWEQTLDLASLTDDPSFSVETGQRPGYYPATIARCLKHLGRSAESRKKYIESLRNIAYSHDPDTALYVNNFLTLLIWRGELASAYQLAELNVRALSWIKDPWRYRWQVEHGCSSIAYLRLLQGHMDEASTLFDYAIHAWDDYPEDRPWIYDYYPYYRSELILLSDPTAHGEALAAIESLLTIACEKHWPESICRGHIQAALVHADRASTLGSPDDLRLAQERLNHARRLTTGVHLPDVAIAHHLAELKVDLTRREVNALADSTTTKLGETIDSLEALVRTSELSLALPEVIAARGAQAYLEGLPEQAVQLYERALSVCRHQGYALATTSPRSLVNWLGAHVDVNLQTVSPVGSTVNLVGLIGSGLNQDSMIACLDALSVA
jgi:tetratricopeptide (TPR) repeat protein